jgi:hypothetical protein
MTPSIRRMAIRKKANVVNIAAIPPRQMFTWSAMTRPPPNLGVTHPHCPPQCLASLALPARAIGCCRLAIARRCYCPNSAGAVSIRASCWATLRNVGRFKRRG